ncbi:MAG: type II toxin-antitoxin system RelE/ParE family toxin [Smithella sp.]
MYNLLFYTNARSDSPVDDFLDSLDKKSRAKVAVYLSLLEEHGPHLRRPYADIVRRKIRELRYTKVRISTVFSISSICVIKLYWYMLFLKNAATERERH